MVREEVRLLRWIDALERLEEVDHIDRRVARRGEDLRSPNVRLRLDVAAVLQEQRIETETTDRIDDLRRSRTDFSAEKSAENTDAGLCEVGLRRLMCPVPQRDMGNLVRHDAGDFALIACIVENAAIDVDEPAGERERINIRRIHHSEAILKLRAARVRRKSLSDRVHICSHLRIIENWQLLLGLSRRLLADLDVVLWRKKIEPRLEFGLRIGDCCDRSEHDHGKRARPFISDHDSPLCLLAAESVASAVPLWMLRRRAAAASDRTGTNRDDLKQRREIAAVDDAILINVTSPTSGEGSVLSARRRMRVSIGELLSKRGNVGGVDETITVAVTALRDDQLENRAAGNKKDIAVGRLSDVDNRRRITAKDRNRIGKRTVINIRYVVERLRNEGA